MKIGILIAGHAPDALQDIFGDYAAMFAQLLGPEAFDYAAWDVVDLAFPDSVDDADGWLITGSRHGAYEDLPFIAPLEDFIRKAYDADKPVIGVCFGHQIVAQALGGKVVKAPDGWAVGRTEYNWGGEALTLNAWHQDQVVELPEGAQVLASNDFCENAAIVYGTKAFTVQPHPEFGDTVIEALITHRSAAVAPDRVDRARARLGGEVDNDRLAAMMRQFFTERRLS